MSSSYHRKCRDCGRTIQLRKMPAGQWVAYEGYDRIHDCENPPPLSSSAPSTSRSVHTKKQHPREDTSTARTVSSSEYPSHDTIDFIDFDIKDRSSADEIKSEISEIDNLKSILIEVTPVERPRSKKQPSRQASIRTLVSTAVRQGRVLSITYTSREGEITQRDIEPKEMDDTYCYAYCRLRKDFRNFRLAGIKRAQLLNQRFARRAGPVGEFKRPDLRDQRSASGVSPIYNHEAFPTINYSTTSSTSEASTVFQKILGWSFVILIIILFIKMC